MAHGEGGCIVGHGMSSSLGVAAKEDIALIGGSSVGLGISSMI